MITAAAILIQQEAKAWKTHQTKCPSSEVCLLTLQQWKGEVLTVGNLGYI